MWQRLRCILMQQSCILHAKYVHIRTPWHSITRIYVYNIANIWMQCGMGGGEWKGRRANICYAIAIEFRDRGVPQRPRSVIRIRSLSKARFSHITHSHCRLDAFLADAILELFELVCVCNVHAVVQLEQQQKNVVHFLICLFVCVFVRSEYRIRIAAKRTRPWKYHLYFFSLIAE